MKTCIVDGCNSKCHSKYYCSMHYQRIIKYGNPTQGSRTEYNKKRAEESNKNNKCKVDGCNKKITAKFLCSMHRSRLLRHGSLEKPIKKGILSLKERFEKYAKIHETDDCINWTGIYGTTGYGTFGVNGKTKKAHRISYEIYKGKITEKKWVLHHCDNSKCVNPKHLYLGDSKRNVHDMIERNRHVAPIGENNGKSKLTNKQVKEIKNILTKSNKIRETARKFNVSRDAIADIKSGKTWRHV